MGEKKREITNSIDRFLKEFVIKSKPFIIATDKRRCLFHDNASGLAGKCTYQQHQQQQQQHHQEQQQQHHQEQQKQQQ